jgi:trehalose/maltose transport system substrate-binding protein
VNLSRAGIGSFLIFTVLAGCKGFRPKAKPEPVLEMMSVTWGDNLKFEENFVTSFGKRNGIKGQLVPNTRLGVYQQLLRAHAGEPDLLELDIVWPSIVGRDLVDLRPYLHGAEKGIVPQLLSNYVVDGKLVALPVYVDLSVLFYRPELLEKYGFRKPPDTWEELEQMAKVIQAGERKAGNKDFWGYTWQGAASEAGTCNFLEWQASAGAGNFVEPYGRVHVRDPRFAAALRRAAGWIGTISPPAEYAYHEDDSMNLWNSGQTAFMRNWASGYNMVSVHPGKDRRHFGVAAMPAGPGGHKGTLGGLGLSVSQYAANRDLAVKALAEMTGEQEDLRRLLATQSIPIHTAVLARPDVKSRSLLLAISADLMTTVVPRPALVTGEKYDQVSLEYAKAVNSVLRRKQTPEAAMAGLEDTLVKMTGLPAQRD